MTILLLFILTLFGISLPGFDVQSSDVIIAAPSVPVEIWVGEFIKRFTFNGTWLNWIKDKSEFANYSTINMAALGAEPEVLVNNVTYPIETVEFDDESIVLNMDKFDTKNTSIPDDILFSTNLDKIGAATDDHRRSIQRTMARKGLHAIAPTTFNSKNFMIPTSGAVTDGFKRAKFDDFLEARLKLQNIEAVGESMLHVVLCSEHERDLLAVDNSFKDKYNNTRTGELFEYMGFMFHKDVYKVYYNEAGTTKRAWGAAPQPGDRYASIIFPEERVVKAIGGLKMYKRVSADDPEHRTTTIGFRRYGIVLPTKVEGFASILATA